MSENKKAVITYENWTYECGDGCCDDWGISLYINGEMVEYDFTGDINVVIKALNMFGIECEVYDEEDE